MTVTDYDTLKRMYEDLETRHGSVCHKLAMCKIRIERLEGIAHPLHLLRNEIYEETKILEKLRSEKNYKAADEKRAEIERKYRVRLVYVPGRIIVQEA